MGKRRLPLVVTLVALLTPLARAVPYRNVWGALGDGWAMIMPADIYHAGHYGAHLFDSLILFMIIFGAVWEWGYKKAHLPKWPVIGIGIAFWIPLVIYLWNAGRLLFNNIFTVLGATIIGTLLLGSLVVGALAAQGKDSKAWKIFAWALTLYFVSSIFLPLALASDARTSTEQWIQHFVTQTLPGLALTIALITAIVVLLGVGAHKSGLTNWSPIHRQKEPGEGLGSRLKSHIERRRVAKQEAADEAHAQQEERRISDYIERLSNYEAAIDSHAEELRISIEKTLSDLKERLRVFQSHFEGIVQTVEDAQGSDPKEKQELIAKLHPLKDQFRKALQNLRAAGNDYFTKAAEDAQQEADKSRKDRAATRASAQELKALERIDRTEKDLQKLERNVGNAAGLLEHSEEAQKAHWHFITVLQSRQFEEALALIARHHQDLETHLEEMQERRKLLRKLNERLQHNLGTLEDDDVLLEKDASVATSLEEALQETFKHLEEATNHITALRPGPLKEIGKHLERSINLVDEAAKHFNRESEHQLKQEEALQELKTIHRGIGELLKEFNEKHAEAQTATNILELMVFGIDLVLKLGARGEELLQDGALSAEQREQAWEAYVTAVDEGFKKIHEQYQKEEPALQESARIVGQYLKAVKQDFQRHLDAPATHDKGRHGGARLGEEMPPSQDEPGSGGGRW